ncbi:Hsp20/alpha crystallin family protein [Micromonospora peucetia]|uniref:Hsp20/alpha crystallin family protein n=1 Tax=Micromonospora peucetia TaxID=47871 RepID=UPI003321B55E
MLMRTDPFREIDRITEQFFGTAARPAVMPLDAYRDGDWFHAAFDLPGVDPDSIDCTVERNVLTVRAVRRRPAGDNVELVAAERPMGTFTRRLFLGDTLDTDRLEAGYDNGVLTLRIPVAQRAKPRRVTVTANSNGNGRKEINA